MKRLLLIDGHAILHRAFHALPPYFNAPDGTPTNAVYGFTTMLLKLLTDFKPDYLAVAFDLPAPTFRSQAYTQYQAKRPEMAGNLSEQIPLAHDLLTALNIAHFEVAGFEADDVIGTLSVRAGEDKEISEVIIVTGDRDMLQLISKKTRICFPVKGLSETKVYGSDEVKAEFGVEPSQWVDVKSLKGDPSDNYPGVPGIGPKTAQTLIAKYNTLENLYSKLGELDKKTALKLAEGAEGAGMAKKLAQIVCDVPLSFNFADSETEKINWTAGVEFMRKNLGFKTIAERVEKQYLGKTAEEKPKKEKTAVKKDQMSLLD